MAPCPVALTEFLDADPRSGSIARENLRLALSDRDARVLQHLIADELPPVDPD